MSASTYITAAMATFYADTTPSGLLFYDLFRRVLFVGTWVLICWSILIITGLVLLVVSLAMGHWARGFSMENTITTAVTSLEGNNQSNSVDDLTSITSNQTQNSDDRYIIDFESLSIDKRHNLWIYVVIFRFIPTVLASNFAMGFLFSLDVNHRFVQPFVNMRQPNGGSPDETVLCTYNTDSFLELPAKALAAGHYKVA